MDHDRYDKWYQYGKVKFFLSDFIPDIEECRMLILKVLEQSIRDFSTLKYSKNPNDLTAWESSRSFLFDDSHVVQWGELELKTEDLLNIVDLDIEWVRMQAMKKLKTKQELNE